MAFEASVGRALAQHARDFVLLLKPDGELVYASESASRAYGRDDLVGLSIRDLRADSTRSQVSAQMAQAVATGVLFETEHLRADGSSFPVEVSSRHVEIDGEPYLLSVVRDITPRRAREQERDELLRDVEAANRQLEGLLKIVSSAVGRIELDQLLSEVLEALREVMDATAALLFVADTDRWRLIAQEGYDSIDGFTLPLGQGFVSQVAQAGQPMWIDDVRQTEYTIPEHERLEMCAMIGVPLYHEGELFGVLECTWREPRLVSEAERVMLLVAADRIMSAVGGAQRYELSRRTQRLDSALSEASTLLSGSHQLEATMPAALEIAAGALECDVAVFGSFAQGVYEASHAVGTVPRIVRMPSHPDVRASDAELFEIHRAPDSSPDADALLDTFSIEAALVIPVVAEGEWFGAVVIGSTRERSRFDETQLAFARRFGRAVAAAHANARDYDSEHQIAETLQEALLSVDLDVPGVSVGHLYRSATSSTRVGGDFYDVFSVPGGRVGILVGDVSGKGLDAAVLTTFVKHTIRAFAHSEVSPSLILSRTNQVLLAAARLPDFASVVLLVVDPESGAITYCSAGHPPPLVVRADGFMQLQECGSPVIGAFPDLEFEEAGFVLNPGDSVILYTDGVTEARAGDGSFFGDDRLSRAVGTCQERQITDVPQLIHEHVMEFTAGRLSDDIAIVAFRLS